VLGDTLPLKCVSTGGKDKVARAGPLLYLLEQGRVFLPRAEFAWRAALEAEWLAWTGLDGETSDQIDAAAYAAMEANRTTADNSVITIRPLLLGE
jgi:phage terminase large subunit-like protein